MKKHVKIKIFVNLDYHLKNITEKNLITESLTIKIETCENNTEKKLTTKISKHILCRYSLLTIWPFDKIENKHCMKIFCISLWEQGTNVINFEKKNVTADRKSAKITSRFNDMLH